MKWGWGGAGRGSTGARGASENCMIAANKKPASGKDSSFFFLPKWYPPIPFTRETWQLGCPQAIRLLGTLVFKCECPHFPASAPSWWLTAGSHAHELGTPLGYHGEASPTAPQAASQQTAGVHGPKAALCRPITCLLPE